MQPLRKILLRKRVFLLLLLLAGFSFFGIVTKDIPDGHSPERADSLAIQVMNELGKQVWDTVGYVTWRFPGGHHYEWYKDKDTVVVSWKDYVVTLNVDLQKGNALKNGQPLQGSDQLKTVEKAIRFFNNDSFWLAAHFKMMDNGTRREIVDLKNGKEGLKVSYSLGGSTPGDTYVWLLEKGKPIAWRMWVSIIPFGGVKTTWEDWERTNSGVSIARNHKLWFFNIRIKDLSIH